MRFFLIISVIFTTLGSYAQQDEQKKTSPVNSFVSLQKVRTIIKTNPFRVLWGPILFTSEYRFVIEQTLSIKQTVQVGISYLGRSPLLNLFEDSVQDLNLLIVSGGRFQLGYKFYARTAPYKIYLSPHISYSVAKLTTKDAKSKDIYITGSNLNINILGGYQLIINDLFVLDSFIGIGYKINKWSYHDPLGTLPIDTKDIPWNYNAPFKFSIGFNIGIAIDSL